MGNGAASWVSTRAHPRLYLCRDKPTQTVGQAAIQQGYRVLYRETHILLEELADAVLDGARKQYMESLASAPLLIIDDFGMRKLPLTAAEDLLEIVMRRYERASTLLTSNRPVEDWGKPARPRGHPGAPVMRQRSAPCSTASCIMDTCSSAAPAVGEPSSIPCQREPSNDRFPPPETEAKRWPKAKRKPGKKRPAAFALDCPRPPLLRDFTKEREI